MLKGAVYTPRSWRVDIRWRRYETENILEVIIESSLVIAPNGCNVNFCFCGYLQETYNPSQISLAPKITLKMVLFAISSHMCREIELHFNISLRKMLLEK